MYLVDFLARRLRLTYPTLCYKEIRVNANSNNKGTSLWDFAPKSGFRKFRHSKSIVGAVNKDDDGELYLSHLRRSLSNIDRQCGTHTADSLLGLRNESVDCNTQHRAFCLWQLSLMKQLIRFQRRAVHLRQLILVDSLAVNKRPHRRLLSPFAAANAFAHHR